MPANTAGLSHVLQQQGLLTAKQADTFCQQADQAQRPLLHYLVNTHVISSRKIAKACADYFNFDYVDITQTTEQPVDCSAITLSHLQHYAFIALENNSQHLSVAISDPRYLSELNELKFHINVKLKPVFIPYDQLTALINHILNGKIYKANENPSTNNSVINIVDRIITDAIYRDASDIHCEPMQPYYRVRVRIDGLLQETVKLAKHLHAGISSRLKVMANLDIAEKRLPQDGRFNFTTTTEITHDCRLSTCPTLFGEKIVIRLLSSNKNLLSFNELGLEKKARHITIKKIQQPQGLIIITGPTGSGKTITLYTMLNYLNSQQKNIVTAEDPIEIQLPGINQVNVNHKIGLGFSASLRGFLRQDPDIIMIGEIRDRETAAIAIRAAHTGHLVLSTLHTNSAAESLTRLMDMGIEPFHIASTLILVVAQRLVRKLCPHCRKKYQHCNFCSNGYKGRTGIYEVMPISDDIRQLILNRKPAGVIVQQAKHEGITNLWQDGYQKVNQGITCQEEIYRVLPQ